MLAAARKPGSPNDYGTAEAMPFQNRSLTSSELREATALNLLGGWLVRNRLAMHACFYLGNR
ncbi:MAG TPA: hypothetical protein VN828_04210, partial [Acidobacteriaceae bacterium]|nr:hypothetical protein [Acidobacteriaceae bacterium]